jgi:hypothetical protein
MQMKSILTFNFFFHKQIGDHIKDLNLLREEVFIMYITPGRIVKQGRVVKQLNHIFRRLIWI